MSEFLAALGRLFTGRGSSTRPELTELDRDRKASMADEGGAAAAEVEAQPTLARPLEDKSQGS